MKYEIAESVYNGFIIYRVWCTCGKYVNVDESTFNMLVKGDIILKCECGEWIKNEI